MGENLNTSPELDIYHLPKEQQKACLPESEGLETTIKT